MRNTELIRQQLNHLVTQARYDILTLSTLTDERLKPQLLDRLWTTISSIQFISDLLAYQTQQPLSASSQGGGMPSPLQTSPPFNQSFNQPFNQHTESNAQRSFTLEELALYDGKNGQPAYVAVDGIVYDVTSNRAWAAATHFGLSAGQNHSAGFASCHAGQQSILATLPVVGRLV
ncbi:cytochrome b5 domain-containing protein [Alkalihalophilus marmarensis]|uniref:cytochrome b5 domain-containing protein n=1 Tax=Alkalihalophilus marmarensis TaxID=521377 RepID=UPI002E22A527|nr:cytochrome b5 domain-containing protein [Alkalihalophilus marmarensis]